MIQDKKQGIKIAENKDEAFWLHLVKEAEGAIENCNRQIIINENLVILGTAKAKEAIKND